MIDTSVLIIMYLCLLSSALFFDNSFPLASANFLVAPTNWKLLSSLQRKEIQLVIVSLSYMHMVMDSSVILSPVFHMSDA